MAIFQYENTEQIERTRLKTMCYAKGLTVPSIRIWAKRKQRLNLSTKKDRSILKERVKQSEAEVVFYDCLSNFHSTDEIKNVELRQVLDTFTEIDADLGTSSVVLHHFNKRTRENSNDPRSRIRGGTTIVDWASSAMTISPRPHEQRHLLQLDFVKVRDGPRIRPLLVERNKDFLLEVAEDETLCPPGRVKDILVGELDGKAKNQTQLKKAVMKIIGCSERSAEGYIRRAVEMDQVKVIDRGHGKAKTYVV